MQSEEMTETLYRQLLDQLPIGVILLNTSGIIQFVNHNAEKRLQMPLTGKAWHQIIALKQSELLIQSQVKTYPFTDNAGQVILIEDKAFFTDDTELEAESFAPLDSMEYIAVDEKSIQLFELAKKVAKTNATVLISGESGTGKEVLAHYIHQESSRASKPFVAINCAAIPETMLESILFGFEKGAFTGAIKSTPGKFEIAQSGTLFLDEISEMSLGLQAKLLRAIQEKEVERLGAKSPIKVNVRIVATTNRDLKQQVSEGKFRSDLFYRLNVFPLKAYPLRERPQDILPLCEYFLKQYQSDAAELKTLERDARQKLFAYSWPGNVREAQNVIQRSLILSGSKSIAADDIVLESEHGIEIEKVSASERLGDALAKQEYQLILETLESVQGNRKQAAEKLDISTRTLRYKLAKMREEGISMPPFMSEGYNG